MINDVTTKQAVGILVVLVLIKFIVHFISLQSAPLLPGFDGGYYAVQVREIILSGMLYYSAPPISFYIFAFFAQILIWLHYGPLPVCIITGIKLGLSIFVALAAVPAYYLGRYIFRKNYSSIRTVCSFFRLNNLSTAVLIFKKLVCIILSGNPCWL